MNKMDWARTLRSATGPSLEQSRMAIDDLFKDVSNALLRGETVVLPLVGNLKVKPKAARPNARDPRTGTPINVPASEVVKLSPCSLIKSRLAERSRNRKPIDMKTASPD